jgi:hypothetical protein
VARLAAIIAALLVPAALAAGGPSAAQQPDFNADCNGTPCRIEPLAAPWEVVDVALDLRTLTVAYESGGCWRGPAQVSASQTRRRIVISVTQDGVVAADTPDGSLPCIAEVGYGTALVRLRHRVAGRPIEGSPRIPAGALASSGRSPRILDMRAADATRALRVQSLRVLRVGRDHGTVAFQSPLAERRLATRTVRITIGRRLFRTGALDRCLERAGIPTRPRTPRPGDADAPDLVLWLRNPSAMASVGLYRDPVRATELAPSVRRNTRRIEGVFERRRYASIAWYDPPAPALRERAHRCVFGPLGQPRS